MTKNLPTTSREPRSILSPSPRAFLDKIAMRRNAVEREPSGKFVVAHTAAPTPDERREYQQRYLAIQEGLARSDIELLKRRMGRFFLLFPVAGQAPGAAADMAEAYASVLSRVPISAVDKACQKYISEGATFRPSAPELLKAADDFCRPIYEEADTLRKILDAEVYTQNSPTERERVKAGWRELSNSLMRSNVVGKPVDLKNMTKDEAERHLEDLKARFAASPLPKTGEAAA